ncbi:MAG: hypothetical protein QFX33_03335 [Candidatus Nezhaarchaeota archaeon]|nr:hypothetical protein [Candidatus Nezhaarchaeota archaeon]
MRKRGLANKERPEVKSVSIWLDDHLWRIDGLTQVKIATHKEWITVAVEPHKQFWRYVNSGWRVAGEAKIKLDRSERRLILYITFKKEVEQHKSKGFISIDVNENSVAVMVDGRVPF